MEDGLGRDVPEGENALAKNEMHEESDALKRVKIAKNVMNLAY